ncbi:MAG: extracellular solute-binding protein [Bradymonadales bacterium]|jgi:arabinogalactan oligomer/maltooligosaccharide transport system permease protein
MTSKRYALFEFAPSFRVGTSIFLIWLFSLCFGFFGCDAATPEPGEEQGEDLQRVSAKGAADVTLWHAYRGDEQLALDGAVEEFRKLHPTWKIDVLPVADESYANKLFTAIPRGSGPDVFIAAHDNIGSWANNQIIADVDAYFGADERKLFHPLTVDALLYQRELTTAEREQRGQKLDEERIYAMPLAYKSPVLFYNKDLVSTPPSDTNELYAIMQKLTDTVSQRYGFVYENTNLFFHAAWLNGFGGTLFNEAGNVEIATENNAASFEFAAKLNAYMPAGVDGARIGKLFNDGTAAMVISGPWFMAELREDLNYGVATMPLINESGNFAAPFVTAEGIFLSKYAKDKKSTEQIQKSVELMQFIAKDSAYRRLIDGKQMVAYLDAYEQLKGDNDEKAAFMKSVAPTFLAQLEHAYPTSSRPEMGSLWASMRQALQKSLFGGPSGETPYWLFLLISVFVAALLLLSKATNPSLNTKRSQQLYVAGSILSFVALIPIIWRIASIQGVNRQVEPMKALMEAQNRFLQLKAPAMEAANPGPFLAVVCGILLIIMILSIKAYKRHKAKNIEYTDNKVAAAFVAPAIIGMIVLVITPFTVGAALSFFSYQNGEFIFVGAQNFVRLFSTQQASFTDSLSFYFTLVVTVLWTVVNVSLHVCFGIILALLLRDPWLKLKGMYRVLFIIPWAMPNYITALIWRGMFDTSFGAINGILVSLGLNRVEWFNEFLTSFSANLITNTWLGFPFMMVVTLGALQAIPRDLEDAASVDGANAIQRFRNVTFPLLKPALMPAVILGSVWTFNAFNIIYLVSMGNPDGSTEILVSEAYKWAFERQFQYGYAAAYAMVVFFILVVYSKLTQLVLEDKQ